MQPQQKAKYEADKLAKRLKHYLGDAMSDFGMINDGDKIMVCVSGGKDSYALLDLLMSLQRYAPVKFELVAVNLDQKQPGFPSHILPAYFESAGIPYHIVERDTYSVVKRLIPEGQTTCSLCSRLRRGILYKTADELGCTKIALGHHRDDILETFFLNLFYGGKIKSMPPKLVSDDGRHMVIRPLAYCRERDLERYAQIKEFPIIPCDLCGSQPNLQRKIIKSMIQDWDKTAPGRSDVIFRALKTVVPSHLADLSLFDFKGLQTQDSPYAGGDTAFDDVCEISGLKDALTLNPLHPSASSEAFAELLSSRP